MAASDASERTFRTSRKDELRTKAAKLYSAIAARSFWAARKGICLSAKRHTAPMGTLEFVLGFFRVQGMPVEPFWTGSNPMRAEGRHGCIC